MKEIFKLILLLVILSGCIENDEEIILNNSDLEDVSEYKRAEDLICQFSERIDKEKGGTRSSTSQIILSLAGKKSVVIPKIATRTGEISTDSVNMFIFDTEKDGRFGFAIATGKAEVAGNRAGCAECGNADDEPQSGGRGAEGHSGVCDPLRFAGSDDGATHHAVLYGL